MATSPTNDPTGAATHASTGEPTGAPTGAPPRGVDDAEREAARARRQHLHHALVELEEALTAPANMPSWLPRVQKAVGVMRDTVLDHVAETEAPDGLLAQIAHDSPWLGTRATQLRDEHDDLVATAEDLVEACAEATTASDELADAAWSLLERVSRHRRRGADLLYDAYALDVSAGD